MEVEIKVPVYEIDGEECLPKNDRHITVKSHWNRTSTMVVLVIDGNEFTVARDAISKAVDRATW